MTQELFRGDAYLRECEATVTALTEHGIVLDRTVFYPTGGGQAGDAGMLILAGGGAIEIADTRKHKDAEGRPTDDIVHVLAPQAGGAATVAERLAQLGVEPGSTLRARIDWERRYKLMRFHTTTHLLCKLVPQLVDGCSITADSARIDFSITDPLDKEALSAGIARLVAAAHVVSVGFITDAELDADPTLVKSMRVRPPRGSGRIRTIRIGSGELIDMQPCGGTHVANTSEIGRVAVTKLEKKSATTRRIVLGFA